MKTWQIVLLCIVGVVVLLLGTVVVKTVTFTSKQLQFEGKVTSQVDVNAAAERLAKALQFKTISYEDRSQIDYQPFLQFQEYLVQTFPLVHSRLERKVINNYALLYAWQGADKSLKPMLIITHYDVVPAPDEDGQAWKYPPFSGTIAEGYIWGRGALDTKSTIMGALEAVEALLKEGYSPKRTVYIASGFDEEIGGDGGAGKIAEYLKSNGVELEYTIDEGSVIAKGIVPGIKAPVALIGIAEKGYVTLELSVEGQAGHSSMPPKQTAVGVLSAAIAKLEANPFPADMSGPTGMLFDYIGPEMSSVYKMLFANRWLFGSAIKSQLSASPATSATIRTTTAATMFNAGVKSNVLPSSATAAVNFRILPGDSVQGVIDHVNAVVDDPRVKVKVMGEHTEPSPVSDINSPSFMTVYKTTKQVFPDAVVAPALVVAGTDSKHFVGVAKNLYRLNPHRFGKEELSMPHGVNERITIDNYEECIQFYMQL
ncbi:MAG: M20 family peptidase, partial [Chloroflexi bacterium]|nr:M20 family peptidase [Chloroflexota bacterium]